MGGDHRGPPGLHRGLHHISSRQPKPALGAGSLPAGHGQTAQTPRKVLPPPPEPQWTFHEVLAEKTVEIPDEPADKTKTANPASPPAPPKTYVLACGTFTGIDRAESLKAQLAMAGLHAQVKTITDAKHGTRYWVGVAPYTSKRAAQKDQHVARGAQIFSCIIL